MVKQINSAVFGNEGTSDVKGRAMLPEAVCEVPTAGLCPATGKVLAEVLMSTGASDSSVGRECRNTTKPN